MEEKGKVWLHGSPIPWEKATVPLLSHGFSRGSAIFDVFGIHEGQDGPVAFGINQHLGRLMKSAELLDGDGLHQGGNRNCGLQTVRANQIGRGLIKILAYWGRRSGHPIGPRFQAGFGDLLEFLRAGAGPGQ